MALIEFDIQSINSVLLIINFIRGMGGMCPLCRQQTSLPEMEMLSCYSFKSLEMSISRFLSFAFCDKMRNPREKRKQEIQ